MPNHPLLIFPQPEIASKSKLGGGFSKISHPDHQRQSERLTPKLQQLQKAINQRNIEICQNMIGIEPEHVLVLETVGSIDKFINAVRLISGLEWLSEIDVDNIIPDTDFYSEKDDKKELSGRLYFIATNQSALNQVLSMWERYSQNEDFKFAHGLTKFRDMFLQLKDIRRWEVKDRLEETGIIEAWQEDLQYEKPIVRCEIELWFHNSKPKRVESEDIITRIVGASEGRVLSSVVHENIAYHGMLAELPATAIQDIIDRKETELVKCEAIMFFRPVGQILSDLDLQDPLTESFDHSEKLLPKREPVVAILDGLPLSNHQALKGRLMIDDPDNWESDYMAKQRIHGTSMASLVVHGDLNDRNEPLNKLVYLRPIMKPARHYNRNLEAIPDDILIVDLIHRAVKRIFGSDGQEAPIAPSIKIINLSIGDSHRQFLYSMSPLARLLDWLSVTYNVLFIVSAGNHETSITLNKTRSEFEASDSDAKEACIVRSLYSDIRNRKLLSPAENINGITVGALYYDETQYSLPYSNKFEPFTRILPNPISAFGGGYRKAIKPDIVYTGGKIFFEEDLRRSTEEKYIIKPFINFTSPPGNKIAAPGNQAGSLNFNAYSCGTSNATALTTRAASICYDSLHNILNTVMPNDSISTYEISLLKAMLVHGCSWGNIGDNISSILGEQYKRRDCKKFIRHWIGYGKPDIDRVLHSTDQRATVLGFGQLRDNEAHLFRLPLPPSLSACKEWKRLTITLAWLSPICVNTQKYRQAKLWFDKSINKFDFTTMFERINGDQHSTKRGTIQHEIFEGDKALPFIDGDTLAIKINCSEDAGKIVEPIAYGLLVSLEVKESINLPIYNEIRERIKQRIKIQPH